MTSEKKPVSKVAIGIFLLAAIIIAALFVTSDKTTTYKTGLVVGQIIGASLVGLLMGLIPYYQGRKNHKYHLAQISLASCTLSGVLFGIISALPTAVIFTIYIRKNNSENPI